jgi:hypothetical protein
MIGVEHEFRSRPAVVAVRRPAPYHHSSSNFLAPLVSLEKA